MRLREGDADHPPLGVGQCGADPGGRARLPQVRGPGRAGRARPGGGGQAAGAAEAAAEGAAARRRRRRSWTRPARPGTTLALRDRALLEVLYGTGARISEAVGLDVDDLDLDQGSGAAARQGRQAADRAGRLVRP